ncbi:hypothetical protein BD560DRAFT_451084 [Blakeslea trispora]|nr:hypothetical protein BD560DRAFT_451084 [Blakeslea trispora]
MKLSLATLILAVAVGTQAASLNPMEKRGVVTDPLCKPLTNCLHKVCNTNSGTGYLGYCCVSDKDCIASCVDNKCTGKRNPKFADPITTTTKAAKTTTKKTSKAGAITDPLCKPLTNCIHKTCNTGNGTGYKGYCCVSDKDCIASCVNNKCTGKSNPKFADPIN